MLNGTWIPQAAEFSGQAIPLPPARWVIAGERYVVESEGGRDEGLLVVDTKVTPHAVDLVGQAGPNAGQTLRAIFRVRGDLLQLCYEVGESPTRPAAFVSVEGSMALTVRYRRVQ
jgi:uncharacterized protein (TIGR03067 family)